MEELQKEVEDFMQNISAAEEMNYLTRHREGKKNLKTDMQTQTHTEVSFK